MFLWFYDQLILIELRKLKKNLLLSDCQYSIHIPVRLSQAKCQITHGKT